MLTPFHIILRELLHGPYKQFLLHMFVFLSIVNNLSSVELYLLYILFKQFVLLFSLFQALVS